MSRGTCRFLYFGLFSKRLVNKIMTTKEKEVVSKTDEMEGAEEAARQNKKDSEMGKLFAAITNPPELESLVEGTVIGLDNKAVYVDLPPYGTGIIYGREFINARDIIRKMNIGDTISAKVISFDNEEGYIEISIKEARQALIWGEAEEAVRDSKVFELPITDANKGGLLINWQGITGFLPASQLKPEHYPRVQDGDKDKILDELKKLIGEKITVSIITALPREGKLIFSEKGMEEKGKGEIVEKYAVGDVLDGEVTGVVEFGVFVKVEEGLEGLVHISEMDWGLVEDPKQLYKIGDKVKVRVIDVKDGKISLSIKQLKENPWADAAKKYKKDDVVDGVIIKFNKHGALASIEEGVAGLVHVSEFGSDEKLRKTLELGKTYKFKINLFEPNEMKMTLSFADKDDDKS
ncbi:MAG: 30S ribosomal protein S1 [Candidatus Zambryskibacteria bacterium CG10_big_fil_rev_8_21_14_0_10_42_12]|uniref:30S ribosomal protein S1 n=1 Tax=Candidatus Zambryskibacteria bacterium CG10_big_fil_rev_8_21_14_0_10_42_12 TaxID=1975115 RepID=A0A2H0QVC6_9BACT|nr:MAG: 30S ribosomal protein S1 [Candidatus Zambryskibacteria bacterium CG10_big_fil_rev_8_21_14_0_10_42_12]